MIASIFVAMSGMQGHQRGLSIISNNVANMNTAGFRGSSVSFADVFTGAGRNGQLSGAGGLGIARALVDTHPGDAQLTSRDDDLSLEGSGFFIVQDEAGELRYTRNGSFEFVDGRLVTRVQRLKVMTRNASGQLVPFETTSLRQNPPKATSKVTFQQEFVTGDQSHTIEPVEVFDKAGAKHTLKLEFVRQPKTSNAEPWKLTVFEGLNEIGSVTMEFIGPTMFPLEEVLNVPLALQGADATEIAFDFTGVIITTGAAESTLAVRGQDGFGVGEITGQVFDRNGVVEISYSNGQKANGPRLTFAVIADESELVQMGDSLFEYRGSEPVVFREAGDDLQVASRSLEGSNVDLTQEFSELILMQRGYQASSQVVSTANDMLQELLQLRSRR